MSTGYSLVGANAQDEGNNLGFGAYFNFTGAGVTAAISGDVVTVTIPGGGAGGTPANGSNVARSSSTTGSLAGKAACLVAAAFSASKADNECCNL